MASFMGSTLLFDENHVCFDTNGSFFHLPIASNILKIGIRPIMCFSIRFIRIKIRALYVLDFDQLALCLCATKY